MKRTLGIAIGIFLVVVTASALYLQWSKKRISPSGRPADTAQAGPVITVGSISLTFKEEIAEFRPFVELLARRLKPLGVSRGRVVVVPTIGEMAELMKKGQVDIYIDSAFPILKVSKLSGAKPFLRRWKRGKKEYHTVIFVRKDSGIKTLRDLNGKMVAFDDPFSTSGYLVPMAMLLQAGLNVSRYSNASSEVPPDRVGYVFSEDDENTMFWVLKKKVPAGALSNDDFKKLGGDRKLELEILARSGSLPRQVVAHRADLRPTWVNEIEDVLLNMDKDPGGKRVLKHFHDTTKFDKFPRGADEALEAVKVLLPFVERDVGK